MGAQKATVKLRRLARKLGVKSSNGDADGTIATLQVGRRLVQDHGFLPFEALFEAAEKYAAPTDPARAFWAAHRALVSAAKRLGLSSSDFTWSSVDEALPVFDDAIRAQGEFNAKAGKIK